VVGFAQFRTWSIQQWHKLIFRALIKQDQLRRFTFSHPVGNRSRIALPVGYP
jgi:hypothetical protein